jgi:hypothetical protein
MNGKPSKTELASKTCNVVSCADFNIGDMVIYDGYTCMVKKKNKQKQITERILFIIIPMILLPKSKT